MRRYFCVLTMINTLPPIVRSTENFDNMGAVGNDSRWDIFVDFHSYLLSSFPLVFVAQSPDRHVGFVANEVALIRHSSLKLTKVNTYGLVYRWEGSDPSLKPILLLGHQGGFLFFLIMICCNIDKQRDCPSDVVPVNNEVLGDWIHPPYSGFYDGTYLPRF